VLAEDATLLEGTERSQIIGSKYKEVPLEDDRNHWSFKKGKGKQPARYCRDNRIKIGSANSYERCVYARQNCLVHSSR